MQVTHRQTHSRSKNGQNICPFDFLQRKTSRYFTQPGQGADAITYQVRKLFQIPSNYVGVDQDAIVKAALRTM